MATRTNGIDGGSFPPDRHELRFVSLHDPGRGLVVPCDPAGGVDLDALTDRQLLAYLGARAMIGREYGFPVVEVVH